MKIETLVATMNTKDPVELYKKMNLSTDALIVNQGEDRLKVCTQINNKELICHSFAEKGVGLSRNSALMRSTGDICLTADDDMIYVDSVEEIIKNAYRKYPDADMIVFNVRIHEGDKVKTRVKKDGRVRKYNALRYGTVTFSFKRDPIFERNIFFSLLFGGGTKYGSGEDSLFIWSVLSNKLKVYCVTDIIADVYNDGSTWFEGYNEKYFFDKGVLFKTLMPKGFIFFEVYFLLKNRALYKKSMTFLEVLKIMIQGSKSIGK